MKNGTKPENARVEQGLQTVARILAIARELFAKQGYAATSMEDVVSKAGVTRGALYHHFTGKKGLFLAVFEQAQRQISKKIVEAAEQAPTPWDQLRDGSKAFLSAVMNPTLQRIVLIDGPSVLGWQEWRRLDGEHGLKDLREGLEALQRLGMLKPLPVEALAHLLSGAMNDAALWIVHQDDPFEALRQTLENLDALLDGLRA